MSMIFTVSVNISCLIISGLTVGNVKYCHQSEVG
jgi:hypothetical protein